MRVYELAPVIALVFFGTACSLINPPEDDGPPPYTDPPNSGDQGKPLDLFFNGIFIGNNVGAPEKWTGLPPVATGESDAPVVTSVPKALRLGPNRNKVTFPVRFTDITMLDPNQAPNRMIAKLRGVDWRWWEYPVNSQDFVDVMPKAFEYGIWFRTTDIQPLIDLGPQIIDIAFGEASGKVGEFVPIELTVTERAAESYQGLGCAALSERFNREAQEEGFGGSYFCTPSGEELCRTTDALSAKCGAGGNPDLVVKAAAGSETLTLDATSKGIMCRGASALIPVDYDDKSGMPFDPRPWDESLGSDATVAGCLTMLDAPGVLDDVRLRGFECCR